MIREGRERFAARRSVHTPARLLLGLLFLLLPATLHAELLVVQIVVNEVPRGEFFVERDAAGRFAIPLADLPTLTLQVVPRRVVEIDGVAYFLLDEFPTILSHFDEKQLSLQLTVPPHLLPRVTLDLSRLRARQVLRPSETSAFLNYSLNYASDTRVSDDAFGLGSEVGFRRGNLLLLSEQRYQQEQDGGEFVRLMSSATWEWRDEMRQLVVGDALTPPGPLDPALRLAGVTLRRNFALDPNFIQYPTIDYAGSVSAPATLEIYQNGMKVRSEPVPPGEFRLQNLTGLMGYGDLEVMLRDRFGRETLLRSPYYLTDQVLRRGLHEYSYSLGALRQGYASSADGYADVVLLGRHRYGVNDQLTAGGGLQAGAGRFVLLPQVDFKAGVAGAVSVVLGASAGDGSGVAAWARYSTIRRPFNGYLEVQGSSSEWKTVGVEQETVERPSLALSAGSGWGRPDFGTLSVDVSTAKMHAGGERQQFGISFSRRLWEPLFMHLSLRSFRAEHDGWQLFLTLTYAAPRKPQTSLRIEGHDGGHSSIVQVERQVPTGAGYGYVAALGEESDTQETSLFVAPSGEYHGRYAVFKGDLRLQQGGESGVNTAVAFGVAGAVTWVGGVTMPARPVRNSFSLVQVGALEGVRVYHNGQEMGRTDHRGRLLLPGLNDYYDNQVAIDDRDVPLDHALSIVEQIVSPPARSGSCVSFAASRSQPVTGRIVLEKRGERQPLEYRQVTVIDSAGRRQEIPTGRGGEFYFDLRDFGAETTAAVPHSCADLTAPVAATPSAQRVGGTVWQEGRELTFAVEIPPSDGLFVDLGEISVPFSEEKSHP